MKKDKLKVYFLEFILVAILAFALFVPSFNRQVLAVGLVIATIIVCVMIKKRNILSLNKKSVIIIFTILAIIYLVTFYLMGLYFGYYKSVVQFSTWSLTNYILPIATIIITSEMIRKVLVAQNTKPTKVITFIIMVLIDLIVYANVYTMDDYDTFIEIIGFTLFASIACNLLYNYVSSRYGAVPVIIYRLITVLYVYFIPYIPNVYIFFRSILRTVYPYLIYQLLEYTYATKKLSVAYTSKKKAMIGKLLVCAVTVVLAMLISCEFKYGILVIGSGSMTGTINKGDAMVFEKYDGQEEIKEGDIVIFNDRSIQVVHRVIEVKNVNGIERYITKGDANVEKDEGYITKNEIAGLYKFRIMYMGYPSLWLRDIFSN